MMTCISWLVLKNKFDPKIIVLRKKIDENEVLEIIDDKKSSLFKSKSYPERDGQEREKEERGRGES